MERWQIAVIFFVFIIMLFIAMWISANCRRRAFLRINNTSVNVVEGDIWTLLKKRSKDRKGEISVIGVNEFFDDIVDNRIVSESSLHGQYIKQITAERKLGALNKTSCSASHILFYEVFFQPQVLTVRFQKGLWMSDCLKSSFSPKYKSML